MCARAYLSILNVKLFPYIEVTFSGGFSVYIYLDRIACFVGVMSHTLEKDLHANGRGNGLLLNNMRYLFRLAVVNPRFPLHRDIEIIINLHLGGKLKDFIIRGIDTV